MVVARCREGPEIPSFTRYPTREFKRGRLPFSLLPCRVVPFVLDFAILLISRPQANVIIDRRGRARLTEYGLATIDSDPSFTVAATPGAVGTSRWLAPEIINPSRKGDSMPVKESKPADVFAFAMFAVEVFTGRIPFEEQKNEAVVLRISRGGRPEVSGNGQDVGQKNTAVALRISRGDRPEIPGNAQEVGLTTDVWKLLEGCWQQNPKKRPTMEEVVRRWERFVDHNDDGNKVFTECV
jgi:serine/threonine protein kinase